MQTIAPKSPRRPSFTTAELVMIGLAFAQLVAGLGGWLHPLTGR